MLYLVGLGLADETDITVKGLNIVKGAERVYLEAYTSILLVGKEKLVSVTFIQMTWRRAYPSATLWYTTETRTFSRKPTMADLSFWQTVRWSSLRATIS